jgi:hypothetical protein
MQIETQPILFQLPEFLPIPVEGIQAAKEHISLIRNQCFIITVHSSIISTMLTETRLQTGLRQKFETSLRTSLRAIEPFFSTPRRESFSSFFKTI